MPRGDKSSTTATGFVTEERLRFPAIRNAAIPWMKRMVRLLAREHLRLRGSGGDLAG